MIALASAAVIRFPGWLAFVPLSAGGSEQFRERVGDVRRPWHRYLGETAFGAVNEHRPRDSRSVANESRIVN
jgi:hypothetical protein